MVITLHYNCTAIRYWYLVRSLTKPIQKITTLKRSIEKETSELVGWTDGEYDKEEKNEIRGASEMCKKRNK